MAVKTDSEDPDAVCRNCLSSLFFTTSDDLTNVTCPVCGLTWNQVELIQEQGRKLQELFARMGNNEEGK